MLTRTFLLKLFGNKTKNDTARYTYEKHLIYVRHWVGQLYFKPDVQTFATRSEGKHDEYGAKQKEKFLNVPLSTVGMGTLANQAQHRARAIISAHRASMKETGAKSNVPQIKQIGCPAKLGVSQTKEFDYWLSVENEFKKNGRVYLPCKSHVRLNKFIKNGWMLNRDSAEFFFGRDGVAYARVFVQKQAPQAIPNPDNTLGVDVGYRNGASRSDGYVGKNTGKIMARQKAKEKAQKRQDSLAYQPVLRKKQKDQLWFTGSPWGGHYKGRRMKSVVKQMLDTEARRAVIRCQRDGKTLCVESPKTIANLASGSLQGWARCYFAKRCRVIGEEYGVFVWDVNPAYTSVRCYRCGKTDKRNRAGSMFECVACGYVEQADVQAARNIAWKGTRSLREHLLKRRVA